MNYTDEAMLTIAILKKTRYCVLRNWLAHEPVVFFILILICISFVSRNKMWQIKE